MYKGCFLGLTTYDILYEVKKFPAPNEKIVALEQIMATGGPATNAAITFAQLGGESTLLSVIGKDSFAQLARDELKEYGVRAIDLAPEASNIPFSSIIVEKGTGRRAVVSINAGKTQTTELPKDVLAQHFDILLVDGHQMALSVELCTDAQKSGVTTVLDGGSWKEGTEKLLPHIDYAICSENFSPPECAALDETIFYLHNTGIEKIAITRGEKSIIVSMGGKRDGIQVPHIKKIRSTLGAGDVFHGAFCNFILALGGNFPLALEKALEVAAESCKYLGARE